MTGIYLCEKIQRIRLLQRQYHISIYVRVHGGSVQPGKVSDCVYLGYRCLQRHLVFIVISFFDVIGSRPDSAVAHVGLINHP